MQALPGGSPVAGNMNKVKFKKMIKKVNLYPPYRGMAIRVRSLRDDFTRCLGVDRQQRVS
jgi:hypothetical protein